MSVARPPKLFHAIVVMGAAFGAACSTSDDSASSSTDARSDTSSGTDALGDVAPGDVVKDTRDEASDANDGDDGDETDADNPCSAPDADGLACDGGAPPCKSAGPPVCAGGTCAWPCFV
jgi:hypothetical protein